MYLAISTMRASSNHRRVGNVYYDGIFASPVACDRSTDGRLFERAVHGTTAWGE